MSGAVHSGAVVWRFVQFARERFAPAQYLPLIAVVALADVAVLRASFATVPLLVLGMTAFFFKLRCYDEIKDYDDDKVHKPTRPLARGLVTHRELYRAIAACFVVEFAAFAFLGRAAVIGLALAAGYSLLMFREFFIGKWLRPHLTTYAVTHTVVAGLLTLAVASAALDVLPWQLPLRAFVLAAATVCLFNVFEFARKTWASNEEQPHVPSYSLIHGRFGAALMTFLMAATATVLLVALHLGFTASLALLGLAVVVGGVGVAYAVIDRTKLAKAYRAVAGAYLLGVFVVLATL